MRVLEVYRDYFTELPGGIERHVHDLAHGLSSIGSIEVLASARGSRPRDLDDGGVRVHLVREHGRPAGVPLAPGFAKVMSRGGYDLVHLHSPNPTGELLAEFLPRGTAKVATFHADLHRGKGLLPVYRRFLTRFLASCDAVIASSVELVEGSPVLSALAQRRPGSIEVVPFGVDLDRFTPEETEHAREIRAGWGRGPVVLFVGRLRYYKGVHVLIEAMRDVDATLVVVGEGLETGTVAALGRRALGSRFVHVAGVSDDLLPDIYRAADLFCLPSLSAAETFGIAALEGMASGLPLVTTEVGTATSVINQHGVTGAVVVPRDQRALAAVLSDLLADEAGLERMGAAGRARAQQHYDKKTMLRRIEEIYERAVAT